MSSLELLRARETGPFAEQPLCLWFSGSLNESFHLLESTWRPASKPLLVTRVLQPGDDARMFSKQLHLWCSCGELLGCRLPSTRLAWDPKWIGLGVTSASFPTASLRP